MCILIFILLYFHLYFWNSASFLDDNKSIEIVASIYSAVLYLLDGENLEDRRQRFQRFLNRYKGPMGEMLVEMLNQNYLIKFLNPEKSLHPPYTDDYILEQWILSWKKMAHTTIKRIV
jgi:hypothetical protein